MKRISLRAAIAILAFSIPAAADAAGSTAPVEEKPQSYELGMAAADSENWESAIRYFAEAIDADPKDADAYNMLAYSQRQAGDLESAFANYEIALEIDPAHEEALEYLGETYLLVGDLDSAILQLEKLDEICRGGCEAFYELQEAIDEFQASRNSN